MNVIDGCSKSAHDKTAVERFGATDGNSIYYSRAGRNRALSRKAHHSNLYNSIQLVISPLDHIRRHMPL